MFHFHKIFHSIKCAVIGMIHVKALPGTPKSALSVQQLIDNACSEATVYKKCNIDGLIVENMFDVPYVMGNQMGPEITAVMTRICSEVKKIVGEMPCGVQILSGNNFSATAVALASGFQFVRIEGYVFAHIADEGMMQACAGPLLRYAKIIGANVLYFTDIKKKHSSHSITQVVGIAQMAKAAEFFLSDGVILTGSETGDPASVRDLIDVQKAVRLPILIGSGVTDANVQEYAKADAVIVGSHFKHDGHWMGNLDPNKVSLFMDKVHSFR